MLRPSLCLPKIVGPYGSVSKMCAWMCSPAPLYQCLVLTKLIETAPDDVSGTMRGSPRQGKSPIILLDPRQGSLATQGASGSSCSLPHAQFKFITHKRADKVASFPHASLAACATESSHALPATGGKNQANRVESTAAGAPVNTAASPNTALSISASQAPEY